MANEDYSKQKKTRAAVVKVSERNKGIDKAVKDLKAAGIDAKSVTGGYKRGK